MKHANREEEALSPMPPAALREDREACVALHVPNTLRVPCDPAPPDPKRWFDESDQDPLMTPVHDGNEVLSLIDGPNTFKAMVDAIRTAKNDQHFIYLLGWWLSVDFPLVPEEENTWEKLEPPLEPPNVPERVRRVLYRLLKTSIRTLFSEADQRGVQIRAMLWDQSSPDPRKNTAEIAFINQLVHGAGILDGRHLNFGSHHQKILVVFGERGLIAFCGGVDINPDRAWRFGSLFNTMPDAGWPMHDVHCRIQGPAAHDLLDIFRKRWDDYPKHSFRPRDHDDPDRPGEPCRLCMPLVGDALKKPVSFPPEPHSQYVQIGRTYGNGSTHDGIDVERRDRPKGYKFAPRGEQTARKMILHGIQKARRFIYIEDQYLVEHGIRDALMRKLKDIEHLSILIPDDNLTMLVAYFGQIVSLEDAVLYGEDSSLYQVAKDVENILAAPDPWRAYEDFLLGTLTDGSTVEGVPAKPGLRLFVNQARARRQDFIIPLVDAFPEKVRVFVLGTPKAPPGSLHTYVHSKMWIIDDEFAIIGSANACRRSMTHDSEAIAAITDQDFEFVYGYHFAHRLRVALWSEHLGLDPAELADGVASVVHWKHLPRNARVARYDHTLSANRGTDLVWSFIDPEGS